MESAPFRDSRDFLATPATIATATATVTATTASAAVTVVLVAVAVAAAAPTIPDSVRSVDLPVSAAAGALGTRNQSPNQSPNQRPNQRPNQSPNRNDDAAVRAVKAETKARVELERANTSIEYGGAVRGRPMAASGCCGGREIPTAIPV